MTPTLAEALDALRGALYPNPDDHGPIAVPSDADVYAELETWAHGSGGVTINGEA